MSGNSHKNKVEHGRGKTNKQVLKTCKFLFPDYMGMFDLGILKHEELRYCEYMAKGLELYIVEQWVSGRKFSNVITSFTGNSSEVIYGILVRLPVDVQYWPKDFKEYHDKIIDFSSVKEMDDGTRLYVTNLSFFPSTLNLLHVKNGSMKDSWQLFQVNFNLKRLGCGSRSGNLLGEPSITSLEKFAQIYKMTTKDPEDLLKNLIELVRVIQISLTYFRLLDSKFKDGTFCQHTVNAIHEWWVSYGKLYLGIDRPKNEGVLGPTTVAGIISFVLTCYFKFIVEDCISFKDPFIESSFYAGIYNFQKKHNLPKTSYLDMETMTKLFKVTSKVNGTDIFKLKRRLKSTVQDIARKTNPIQLANEILTTDLDWLIENVQGGYLGLFWSKKRQFKVSLQGTRFYDLDYNHGDPFKEDDEYLSILTNEADTTANDDESREKHAEEQSDIEEDTPEAKWSTKEPVDSEIYYCNNQGFRSELYRRATLPQISKDKNIFQTDHKSVAPTSSDDEQQPRILGDNNETTNRRRYSFSDIQETMEIWTIPFQVSPVRLARDILHIEIALRQYDAAEEEEEEDDDDDDEGCCNKNKEDCVKEASGMLDTCKRDCEALKDKDKELRFKRSAVDAELKELNSLEAKFNYDLRILDTRMRDVEQNLSQFGNRLNTLEEGLKLKSNQFKALIETDIISSALELDKYAFEFLENEQVWNEGVFLRSLRLYIWPIVKMSWDQAMGWWKPTANM